MKIVILLTNIVMISSSFAANNLLYRQESKKSMSISKIKRDSDIYLSNESLLRDGEGENGIYTDYFYTKKDSLRFSIGYQFAQDFENISQISTVDLQIHKKFSSYKDQWFGVQIKRVVGQYDALADELDESSNPEADGNIKRGTTEQTMTIVGLGFGYRFKGLTQMFSSDRVFENIMAFGNYVAHLDKQTSKKYSGYGLTAEYAIQRRISEALFFNFKIGYNIASVERSAEDDEKKEERSLVFKWSTLGFDIGYYF